MIKNTDYYAADKESFETHRHIAIERTQILADTDVTYNVSNENEHFRRYMINFCKNHSNENGELSPDFFKIFEPHGLTVSHEIKFPMGGNMFSSNPLKPFMDFVKGAFGICASYKFWLAFYIIVLLYSYTGPQQESSCKSVRTLKYFTLSMMMLCVVSVEIQNDNELSNDISEANAHFWESLAPLWKEMQQEEPPSDGWSSTPVEMEPIKVYSPQGLSDFIPGTATVLMGCLSVLVGFRVKEGFVSTLIHMTKASPAQITNITSALVFGFNSLSKFFKSIDCENISNFLFIDVCSSTRVSSFCDKSRALIAKVNTGEIKGMAFYAEVYGDLLLEGETLIKSAEKNSYDSRVLIENLKKLRDCQERVETIANSLKGIRPEPVGVLLRGTPGIGKSVLLNRLAHVVAEFTLPMEWAEDFSSNPAQFIYAKPIDKFYDNYTYKAYVVVIDDLCQARDAVGDSDSEAMTVIRMVNTAEFPLPMAKVESKNSTYYRSPFLMCGTNLPDFRNVMSITDKDALERRFNMDISVKVNPIYCDEQGKVDLNKLPTIDENSDIDIDFDSDEFSTYMPSDFWELSVIQKTANSFKDPVRVTFEELVEMIVKLHHSKIKNYYVNRWAERKVMQDIRANLSKTFPTGPEYSNAMFKTFKPQAGMPGDFPEMEDIDIAPILEINKRWHELDKNDQNDLLRNYFDCLFRMSSDMTPLFHLGWNGIMKHLHVIPIENVAKFYDLFISDRNEFVVWLARSYSMRLSKNLHPLEKKKFRAEPYVNTEKILIKMTSVVDPIIKFVDAHKYILLIGGGALITSLFWLNGFVGTFLPTRENVISQSVDLKRDRNHVGKKPTTGSLSRGSNRISIRPQAPKLDFNLSDIDTFDTDLKPYTSFLDINGHDVLEKVLKKYLFIMYIVIGLPDGKFQTKRFGHALNVRGKIFMMPMHYAYLINDIHHKEGYVGASIVFTTVSRSTTYSCSIEDVMSTFGWSETSADNDYCLFELSGAHPTSTGALNYFIKEKDLLKLGRMSSFDSCIIGTYRSPGGIQHVRSEKVKSSFLSEVRVNNSWSTVDNQTGYVLNDVISYQSNLYGGGDCGAINSILSNDFENRCLMGMHIAGDNREGFSCLLTQDRILAVMDAFYPNATIFEEEDDIPHTVKTSIEAQGLMMPVSELLSPYIPGDISKSEIIRSELFGNLPEPFRKVKEFPAKLRSFVTPDGEYIDPLLKAQMKYAKPDPIHFESGLVARAVSSYETLITHYMNVSKENRKEIPLSEALHAFGNVKGIASSTSPGYPFCLPIHENVKKNYYDAVQQNNQTQINYSLSRFATLGDEMEKKWKNKIRPAILSKDCPKDETRPISKVKDGSTRLFSAGDFIYLLKCRQKFGSFMSSFFEANIDVGSAIGINPYSRDWDRMARKMSRFSNNKDDVRYGAGDYSKFDTCLRPEILWEILEIINRWYGKDDPNNQIRRAMWAEIIESRHVLQGKIYVWKTGMPSGNPLTSIINTMYNNIVLRMSYQLAGYDADSFNDNVQVEALGDDNIFSVSDAVKEGFNEIKLPELMDKCGMIYTTELKVEALIPLRKLTDIGFLKRSFRYDPSLGRWVAPLEMDSIFTCLNWSKKGILKDQITADMIPSALSELSLHGKEVFDNFSHHLLEIKNRFLPSLKPSREICTDFRIVYSDVLKSDFVLY